MEIATDKWMILLLKLVLVAILKNVLRTFIENTQNALSVKLKQFLNDTIIKIMRFSNKAEINMHFLKT